MRVGEPGVPAQVNAQGLGRALGLRGAGDRVAAGAAAGELDIVTMGRDGEKVDLLAHLAVSGAFIRTSVLRRGPAAPLSPPARCRRRVRRGSTPPSRSRRSTPARSC